MTVNFIVYSGDGELYITVIYGYDKFEYKFIKQCNKM